MGSPLLLAQTSVLSLCRSLLGRQSQAVLSQELMCISEPNLSWVGGVKVLLSVRVSAVASNSKVAEKRVLEALPRVPCADVENTAAPPP